MRKVIGLLALIGTLFSGYLTISWFLAGSCSFGCSSLLGYPTCMYGFALFGLLFVFSLLDYPYSRYVLATVAIIGVLFSLWFALKELSVCISCYPLGLPNCVYGLLLYLAIAGLALMQPPTSEEEPQQAGRRR